MSKKRMIIVAGLTLIAVLVLAGAAYAQGPRDNSGGRGGRGYRNQDNQSQTRQNGTGTFTRGQGVGTGLCGQGCDGECLLGDVLPPATEGELPEDVIAALEAGLQDEHNAYNTYTVIMDEFGEVRPFVNIREAEAQHIEALEFLFNRYDVPIPEPAALETTPEFDTLADACQAGADAEVANFGLYDEWLETVSDYPDMVQVFTALRDASEFNHLPAFERCSP